MGIRIQRLTEALTNLLGLEGGPSGFTELDGFPVRAVTEVFSGTDQAILLINDQSGLGNTQLAWQPLNSGNIASTTRLPPGWWYRIIFLKLKETGGLNSVLLNFSYVRQSGGIFNMAVKTVAAGAEASSFGDTNLHRLSDRPFGIARPGEWSFNRQTSFGGEGWQFSLSGGATTTSQGLIIAVPIGGKLP